MGVAKVNYGTGLKQRYIAAVRRALAGDVANPHALLGMGGPQDVMVAGRRAVREAVLERLPALGCRWEGLRIMAEVGCAGILVADMLCGPVGALPQPGQLLTVDDIPAKAGGCAANVAIDLARQEVSAAVVGCVGRDAAAQVPLAALRAHGVDCGGIVETDRLATSKTVILLVKGEDRRYIHSFGANAALTVGHIRREWLAGLRVFYLGGLFVLPGLRPPNSSIY